MCAILSRHSGLRDKRHRTPLRELLKTDCPGRWGRTPATCRSHQAIPLHSIAPRIGPAHARITPWLPSPPGDRSRRRRTTPRDLQQQQQEQNPSGVPEESLEASPAPPYGPPWHVRVSSTRCQDSISDNNPFFHVSRPRRCFVQKTGATRDQRPKA